MRFLRSYGHVAEIEHWCDRCCDLIFPGESYEAEVFVTRKGGKKGILTLRRHADPECEPPEDPDDSGDEEVEEEVREAA